MKRRYQENKIILILFEFKRLRFQHLTIMQVMPSKLTKFIRIMGANLEQRHININQKLITQEHKNCSKD